MKKMFLVERNGEQTEISTTAKIVWSIGVITGIGVIAALIYRTLTKPTRLKKVIEEEKK